jgi:hypothetical protein
MTDEPRQTRLDRIAAALERKNYPEATQLLKPLYRESPNDPWVQFYIGRLYEETDKINAAEKMYRQLLRDVSLPKLLTKARQGLQRLEQREKEQRQQAIAQLKSDPRSLEQSVLILEATPAEKRTNAAQALARILQIDPYTARLRLQTHGWRLYRIGTLGELQVYGEELRRAQISVFWAALSDIAQIQVFRVRYFQSITSQSATVVCQDDRDRLGALTFNWSEVSQRVDGRLPVFVNAVHYDISRKSSQQIQRKTETHDYAQVCDLQLPDRRCFLRFGDWSYQFLEGVALTAKQPQSPANMGGVTNRINWNALLAIFNEQLPHAKVLSEFTPFAETAIEYSLMLERLTTHIDLPRKEPSDWDAAFQLYSGLAFLKTG